MHLVHVGNYCTDRIIYKEISIEIEDRYCDFIPVHRDGQWVGNYVACTIVFPSDNYFHEVA